MGAKQIGNLPGFRAPNPGATRRRLGPLTAGSELEVIGRNPSAIARKNGDASLQIKAGFSRISGIEIECLRDGLAKAFVGVAEDDYIRVFADNAAFDLVRWRVGIDDMVNEKFAIPEPDKFDFSVVQAGIVVAHDGCDRGNTFEFEQKPRQSDIAGVDDMVHALKMDEDLGIQMAMSI